MITRHFVYFSIVGISLILLLGVIVPPANAIEIGQGDDVYLGETVDIALALAWPDYTVAWCSSGYEGCLPPDQVIQVTGFMHKYYVDPNVFHPGWYYRWDGKWNSGENQQAFRVRTGTRPKVNITPTATPTPKPVEGIDARGNGPFTWTVARGDSPDIGFRYNSTTDVCGTGPGNSLAHVWLFGATTVVADKELTTMKNDNYEYAMNAKDTEALDVGKYTGYIQFPGVNTRQDVFYDPIARCLDTPYDDAVYPDVPVDPRFPVAFKKVFDEIVRSEKYSDDLLVPITMNLVEPSIRITDIEQRVDELFIAGKTTWSNGTVITLRLDPDNYALPEDKRRHTWTVKAEGDIVSDRSFSTSVPINMKDMYLGVHELRMTVDKNNYVSDTFHNFKITALYVTPTPTPELRKYITDMNNNPITVVTTVVPVVTTVAPVIATEVPTARPTPVPTTVPTPVPTVIIPVETTPALTLPLNPLVGLFALCVAWLVVRR